MKTKPRILKNVSLKEKNTFHIDAKARYYAEFSTLEELRVILNAPKFSTVPKFILGGGSNTVFSKDFDGLVIHPVDKSVELVDENHVYRFVKVGAGADWPKLVARFVSWEWAGLENLSGVPGTVGGAAVQNIGAYGVEVAERIREVECYDPQTDARLELTCEQCDYGYRTSLFKRAPYDRLIVLSVTFALPKIFVPEVKYKDLAACYFRHPPVVTPAWVAHEVLEIRRRKLPNLTRLGCAGSFFKNPILTRVAAQRLLAHHPDAVSYRLTGARMKFSAGWFIEKCRLKSERVGDAGLYSRHVLVLVNHGEASGEDVLRLAQIVVERVKKRFGVQLELEPVVV